MGFNPASSLFPQLLSTLFHAFRRTLAVHSRTPPQHRQRNHVSKTHRLHVATTHLANFTRHSQNTSSLPTSIFKILPFKHNMQSLKNKHPLQFLKRFFSTTHLDNVGPIASRLDSRGVIRFRGPDTIKFLQGLVTNDVRRFGEEKSSLGTPNMAFVAPKPMYAAMLTAQGRFLYDMFLYKPPPADEKIDVSGSGPGPTPDELVLLADVDCSVLDEFLDTLKKYRLRSKVDIENVAKDFSCWQRYGGNLNDKSSEQEPEASVGWGGGMDRTGMSASRGSNVGWQWYSDPRLQCLGFRGIFPSDAIPPLVEADKETDEKNYLLWRLEKGVAEGSTEMPKGEAIPLEYNLAGLNAISFDKGCYVGQELIARSHHRGVIRKRLLPLKFVNDNGEEVEQKAAPKSEVIVSSSGKKAGTVTTALGSRGLGLLRLEEAFKGSRTLAIHGQDDVKVEPVRPDWWPREWFLEHDQTSAAA